MDEEEEKEESPFGPLLAGAMSGTLTDDDFLKAEKFLKELKEFSRLLLILSVATITVFSSLIHFTEKVHWLYKVVIIGQIACFACGVWFHIVLLNIFERLYRLSDEPVPSENKSLHEWLMLALSIQFWAFLISTALLVLLLFAHDWLAPAVLDKTRPALTP